MAKRGTPADRMKLAHPASLQGQQEPQQDESTQVDENFAQNLREYREGSGISQEELAQRMTAHGFKFNQNTIWRIEQGKRPVRIGEAVALAEVLGLPAWRTLTTAPRRFQLGVDIDRANRRTREAYDVLKAAASTYLEAQLNLAFSVREATDAGQVVSDLQQSWLSIPAEEAVIQARVEGEHADDDAERVVVEVGQIIDTLREHGHAALIDPADFTYE